MKIIIFLNDVIPVPSSCVDVNNRHKNELIYFTYGFGFSLKSNVKIVSVFRIFLVLSTKGD